MLEREDGNDFSVECDTEQCGKVEYTFNATNYQEAEEEFQRLGWTKVGRNWFCPQCDAPPRQLR